MPFATTAPSVTTTATLLVTPTTASTTDPVPVVIFNNGAATLYIGGSGVTSATGFPILQQTGISFRLGAAAESLYGIVAAGTLDVRVLVGRS